MTVKNIFGFAAPLSVENGGTGNNVLIGYIGNPGTAGFGVGTCPTANLPASMTPMSGCFDPTNANYGNYQYVEGSVMVFIPKFYYKIGTGANGLAFNVADIKGIAQFSSTVQANDAGYALHRAFIDGGVEQVGFFFDKYKASKVAKGAGYVGASIKNGLPLSTAADHNPIADLTASGGVNAYYKAIDCAHARDGVDGAVNAASVFHVTSLFQKAALALLSIAHGQASVSTAWCAWYDGTGAMNYPKGCNNNALRDVDDTSVLYVTDGYSNCGKTGSGDPFAKTTHNGQACGVADLNGLMYKISLGVTCIASMVAIAGMSRAAACVITWVGHGLATNDFVQIEAITQADWTGANGKIWQITKIDNDSFSIPFNSSAFGTAYNPATDPGTIIKGTFYAAKQATAMKSFTSGNAGATDHWGATGCAAMMDAFVPPFKTAGGGVFLQRFGSWANQVLSEALSGAGWLLAGMGLPKDAGGIDVTGTNLFGKDYFYQYIRNELCLLSCAPWDAGADAGVWCLNLYSNRTGSASSVSWRVACYPV
jgi:hypothetical protein